jgi:thymidylate synthase ThyX
MAYADAKHRPHAVHTGEEPTLEITHGPKSLVVQLDSWGPKENLFPPLYDALQSNWGDEPSNTTGRTCPLHFDGLGYDPMTSLERIDHEESWQHQTGWCRLLDDERAYVESCFAGKTLQQALERLTFSFRVEGVTRAFTHEFVRARIGSGFMQHGGRDNDWRHRKWTMPETMERMCEAYTAGSPDHGAPDVPSQPGKLHCIVNWKSIDEYMLDHVREYIGGDDSIRDAIETHLREGKRLYSALVDAGIPWQDARRVLPIGTQTYIHGDFNYVALKGVLANRLEHIMDWEINCVAQLMLREIHIHCPPMFAQYLGSHSDLAGKAMFERLESWPPDGKYPATTVICQLCAHAETNHHPYNEDLKGRTLLPNEMVCEVCERMGRDATHAPLHQFVPVDKVPRQHRREQMPFFVLHPDSMKGGPIQWLWTNGNYQDIKQQLEVTGGQEV